MTLYYKGGLTVGKMDALVLLQAQLSFVFFLSGNFPKYKESAQEQGGLGCGNIITDNSISLALSLALLLRADSRFEGSAQRISVAPVESGLGHLC